MKCKSCGELNGPPSKFDWEYLPNMAEKEYKAWIFSDEKRFFAWLAKRSLDILEGKEVNDLGGEEVD